MFYDNLKQICSEKGVSPSAVCVNLKMSKSNVTRWKRGGVPNVNTVMKIAKHFKIKPGELLPKL